MIRNTTIAAGGVAGLALALAAVAVPAHAETLDGWNLSETRATGHYERTADGLHIWTEGAASTDKVAGYLAVDLPLSENLSGGLEYTAKTGITPGAQFKVDIDGDGLSDGTLVGESVYGDNWWLTNGSSPAFKALDPSGVQDGGNGSAYFGTLAEWSTAAPAARIVAVGFSLGSGVLGDGVLRAVVAGDHRYTFDPYTAAGCTAPVTLPTVTDRALGDWIVKPTVTPVWEEGAVRLTSTQDASAWAMLNLPAGTHLADLSRLAADGERSGIWWGGIILEGGDLTAQLHFDDDGRFWTDQEGIFPGSSVKGGYYESRDLANDLQSNPVIGSIKVYVNAGMNSIALSSVDYGCSTQAFAQDLGPVDGDGDETTDPEDTTDGGDTTGGGGTTDADGDPIEGPITETEADASAAAATTAGLAHTGFDGTGLGIAALLTVLLGAGAMITAMLRRRAAGARG